MRQRKLRPAQRIDRRNNHRAADQQQRRNAIHARNARQQKRGRIARQQRTNAIDFPLRKHARKFDSAHAQQRRQQRKREAPARRFIAEAVERPAGQRRERHHNARNRQRARGFSRSNDRRAVVALIYNHAPIQEHRNQPDQPGNQHRLRSAQAVRRHQRKRQRKILLQRIDKPHASAVRRAGKALPVQKPERRRHEHDRRQRNSQRIAAERAPRGGKEAQFALLKRKIANHRVNQQKERFAVQHVKPAQRRKPARQRQQSRAAVLKYVLQSCQHQRKMDIRIQKQNLPRGRAGKHARAQRIDRARKRAAPAGKALPFCKRHARKPGKPHAHRDQNRNSPFGRARNRGNHHQQRIAQAVIIQARQHVGTEAK